MGGGGGGRLNLEYFSVYYALIEAKLARMPVSITDSVTVFFCFMPKESLKIRLLSMI